ncbi:MAG: flagellar biosynthesis anti-sigma factor FlgM [Pseudomonadota bacterium]
MKINLDALQGAKSSSNVAGNTKAQGTKAPEQSSSSGGEQIQISELSRQLHAFESSLASSSSDFDTKRVDEIKQAITEGRFTVNAGAVADKLLASVQELVNGQKK